MYTKTCSWNFQNKTFVCVEANICVTIKFTGQIRQKYVKYKNWHFITHTSVNDSCGMRYKDSFERFLFSKSHELTLKQLRIKRKPANRYVTSVLAPSEACVRCLASSNRFLYKEPMWKILLHEASPYCFSDSSRAITQIGIDIFVEKSRERAHL